jgi:hypothetical protein
LFWIDKQWATAAPMPNQTPRCLSTNFKSREVGISYQCDPQIVSAILAQSQASLLKPLLAATPDPVNQNSDEPLPGGKTPENTSGTICAAIIRAHGI